jgi:hypothetical protein
MRLIPDGMELLPTDPEFQNVRWLSPFAEPKDTECCTVFPPQERVSRELHEVKLAPIVMIVIRINSRMRGINLMASYPQSLSFQQVALPLRIRLHI